MEGDLELAMKSATPLVAEAALGLEVCGGLGRDRPWGTSTFPLGVGQASSLDRSVETASLAILLVRTQRCLEPFVVSDCVTRALRECSNAEVSIDAASPVTRTRSPDFN